MSIRVLVVDDSATARIVICNILNSDKYIKVIDTAANAYIARDKIVALKPDVVTLDIEMPRMDGVSFLKKLMQYFPIPVIIVSSLTCKGAQITLDALDAGAIDFVAKPHAYMYDKGNLIAKELISKVKMAFRANVFAKIPTSNIKKTPLLAKASNKIIVIGASTGGISALKTILMSMPHNAPATLVVQHMPGGYTSAFAQRLNKMCIINVKEAKNGNKLQMGQVLIAPGDYHMVIRKNSNNYIVNIGAGKTVSGHKPSIDVLFNSVAKSCAKNSIGIILTGMGMDGAKGMKNMHDNGAKTIAQDEKSCVVFGMPKVSIELGAVDHIVSLPNIASKAMQLL